MFPTCKELLEVSEAVTSIESSSTALEFECISNFMRFAEGEVFDKSSDMPALALVLLKAEPAVAGGLAGIVMPPEVKVGCNR